MEWRDGPVKTLRPRDRVSLGGIIYQVHKVTVVNRAMLKIHVHATGDPEDKSVQIQINSETLWRIGRPQELETVREELEKKGLL